MSKITKIKENNAIVKALKNIDETKWQVNSIFSNLETALTSLNLYIGSNSGWYIPTPLTINGLNGIFVINQDGCIYPEGRIIKENEDRFKVETMTIQGYNEFEKLFLTFMDDNFIF